MALSASTLVACVTFLASVDKHGAPLRWITLLAVFCGGMISGMGIAKAKRDSHDAWVRQTFKDFVISGPNEMAEAVPPINVSAPTASSTRSDQVLSLPHDAPGTDVILSLPHKADAA